MPIPIAIMWNGNYAGQYWPRWIFPHGFQNHAETTSKMTMTATARISPIDMGLNRPVKPRRYI